ncbi:DUF1573 domain-containing protein [Tautonia sociabilis]|uniref:DUF1573 domain-containing protein n=1 Tax=Tautonia sociabilis TaxID=2080755 RepID=A0A432MFJ1_9BACT|nr:DUF1573 domain-containing protein [Tautonia sociabilis]RUL84899.1 DUF1573 domain-containing protein [Tautonia sociabilis]
MDGSRGAVGVRRRQFIGVAPAILGALLLSGRSRAAEGEDWVEAVFPDRSHDFGTVARGSILRHRFRITNRTNREVNITGYKPKCGCTDITVGAQTIPPGAQTTVEAIFDTTRYHGFKSSGLTLTIDRPALRSIDYQLTAYIQDELVVEPGVIDFGEVRRGEPAERVVTLRYLGGRRDWRVTDMRHENSALSAELYEASRTDAEVRYRLVAALDPDRLENGHYRDEITLKTSDPERPSLPISVAAKVVSDITVSPSVLNLGTLKPGQSAERIVLIKGSQPFRITGTRAVEGSIAPAGAPSDASKRIHQVKVAIQAPSSARGGYHAILEITTDRPDEPPARLTAFATVVP